jgi:hypothetical protein
VSHTGNFGPKVSLSGAKRCRGSSRSQTRRRRALRWRACKTHDSAQTAVAQRPWNTIGRRVTLPTARLGQLHALARNTPGPATARQGQQQRQRRWQLRTQGGQQKAMTRCTGQRVARRTTRLYRPAQLSMEQLSSPGPATACQQWQRQWRQRQHLGGSSSVGCAHSTISNRPIHSRAPRPALTRDRRRRRR